MASNPQLAKKESNTLLLKILYNNSIVCLLITIIVMEIQVFIFKTSLFILSFYLVFTLSVFFLFLQLQNVSVHESSFSFLKVILLHVLNNNLC